MMGSDGYFGKAGSIFDFRHITNSLPRSLTINLQCLHISQSPAEIAITNDIISVMDEPWKFCIEERVRWGDVDAARIIFYGAYIRFFEFAETELFRSVGLPYGTIFDQLDVWLPRVHIECDFHRAAQLDDLLEVCVFVGQIGTKSLRLNFEVRKKSQPELVADAHFILVSVRRDTFETIPMPKDLLERLTPYTDPSVW